MHACGVCVCVMLLHAAHFCIFHFGIFKGPIGRLAVYAKANSLPCKNKDIFINNYLFLPAIGIWLD